MINNIKSAFKSETVTKIASNTLYQIIGKVISMAITIGTTIIVTRAYGRDGYGEFSLMQNWPGLFFVIVDFGLNAIATRELSKDFTKASKYLGNILIFRITFSAILILALSIALQFFPYSFSLKLGIALSLIQILTQALYTTTNIIFQVKLKYDDSTKGYIAGYLLILAMVLGFSFIHASITLVSLSYVFGGIVTYFLNIWFIKKHGIVLDFSFDPKLLQYLLLSALPLGLMFVFSQINFKADSIMLSILPVPNQLGLNRTEAVAVYALPYKIFEVCLVIPTFFLNSVYPVMVLHMQESKKRLFQTFSKSLLFLFVSGVLCGVVGVILAPVAINLLGGAQFGQSVVVLQILLGGIVIYYLTQPLSWLIVTLNKQIYLPFIYFISAVINMTANYVFIPQYSFYASAVITHVSELIILILLTIACLVAWRQKYA